MMHPQTPLNQRITYRIIHPELHDGTQGSSRARLVCQAGLIGLMFASALATAAPMPAWAEPDSPPDITWSPSVPTVNTEEQDAASSIHGNNGSSSPSDAARQIDPSGDVNTTGTSNPGVSPAAEGSSLLTAPQTDPQATSDRSSTTSGEHNTSSTAARTTADSERVNAVDALSASVTDRTHRSMLVYGGAAVLGVSAILAVVAGVYLRKRKASSDKHSPSPGYDPNPRPSKDISSGDSAFEQSSYKPSHFAPKDAREIKDKLMQDMGLTVQTYHFTDAHAGVSCMASHSMHDSVQAAVSYPDIPFEKEKTGRLAPQAIGSFEQRGANHFSIETYDERVLASPNQGVKDLRISDDSRLDLSLTGSHFIKTSGALAVNVPLDDTDAYLAHCGIALNIPSAAKAYETFVPRDAFNYDPPFESTSQAWRPLEIASIEQMEADAHRDRRIKDQVEHTYHEVAAEIEYLARQHKEQTSANHSNREDYEERPVHNPLRLDAEVAKQATHFTQEPKGFDLHKMFSDEFVEPVHQAESPISRVAQLAIVPETEVPSVEAPSRDQVRRNRSMAIGNTDMFLRAVLETDQELQQEHREHDAVASRVSAVPQRKVAGAWSRPSGRSFASTSPQSAPRYSSKFDYVSAPSGQEAPGDDLLFFAKDRVADEGNDTKRRHFNNLLTKGRQSGDQVVQRLRAYWA